MFDQQNCISILYCCSILYIPLNVIKEINPRFIIFMEPGTKNVFKQLLPIREKLIETGFNKSLNDKYNPPQVDSYINRTKNICYVVYHTSDTTNVK